MKYYKKLWPSNKNNLDDLRFLTFIFPTNVVNLSIIRLDFRTRFRKNELSFYKLRQLNSYFDIKNYSRSR